MENTVTLDLEEYRQLITAPLESQVNKLMVEKWDALEKLHSVRAELSQAREIARRLLALCDENNIYIPAGTFKSTLNMAYGEAEEADKSWIPEAHRSEA